MEEVQEASRYSKTVCIKSCKKYTKIVLKYVNRDSTFFNVINSVNKNDKIEELHVFSHSISAGLFLGYKDPAIAARRKAIWLVADKAKRKVAYLEAVRTEVGAVQTNGFYIGAITARKAKLQSKFGASAFIKIWGCNSGIENLGIQRQWGC